MFQHDMAGVEFKDLNRRVAAGKVLQDKTFNIAKNQIYDGYQLGIATMVYKFFYKKKLLVKQLEMKLYLMKN